VSCTPILATAGSAGTIETAYTYRQSSTMAAYCGQITLPVDLVHFTLSLSGSDAGISWTVTDISDVKMFTLERRMQNGSWTAIRTIIPVQGKNGYAVQDAKLLPGIYHYRLKIEDYNGNTAYSGIEKLEVGVQTKKLIVFPNPASSGVTVVHPLKEGKEIRVFDPLGRTVLVKKIRQSADHHQLDIAHLPKGVYRVVVDHYHSSLVIH
jgi:hypothetical protein